MTHRRSIVLALAVAPILPGCAAIGAWFGKEISVTHAELTERLVKRVPLEKDLAGLVGAKLTRPRVFAESVAGKARLATTFDVELRLPLGGKSLFGTLTLSGVPRFDASRKAIFLGDIVLDRVRIDRMPDALSEALAKFATQLARDEFDVKPIYALKEEDARKLGDALTRARVEVKPESLTLTWR